MSRLTMCLAAMSAPLWISVLGVLAEAGWLDAPGSASALAPYKGDQWYTENGWVWNSAGGYWHKRTGEAAKPLAVVEESVTVRQPRFTGNPAFPIQAGGCADKPAQPTQPVNSNPPLVEPPGGSGGGEEPPVLDPVDIGGGQPATRPPAAGDECACGPDCQCNTGGQGCLCGAGCSCNTQGKSPDPGHVGGGDCKCDAYCQKNNDWHAKIYKAVLENHRDLEVLAATINDIAINTQNVATTEDLQDVVIVLNRLTNSVATQAGLDAVTKNQTELLSVVSDLAAAVQKADPANEINDLKIQLQNLSQQIDKGHDEIAGRQNEFAEAMAKLKLQVETIGKGQAKFRFRLDPVTNEIVKVEDK